MKEIQVGFIGSGFIANFMVEAMQQVRGINISALYKRSGTSALADVIRHKELGELKIYDSIEEVCNHCDVVAIMTPNHTRVTVVEAIVDAVKKGAPLKAAVCEKPLGRTVAEARRIVELADEADLLTFYFENQLHMSSINKALKQLKPQQEAMGPLVLARSTEEHAGPHSSWFWDPTKQGGGALSDMGCHSIACSRHMLTPVGKPHNFLKPVSVQCDTALLKWGQPKYRQQLKDQFGVDYSKTPAEDFCSGIITFANPETEQHVKAQFTNSWMYDKQGLRLAMEATGPGYGMEVDTLRSPMELFIGDAAAEAVSDAETFLEKSTASRGLLVGLHNEADLYGYVAEWRNVVDSLNHNKDGLMNWQYGSEVTWLVQAAYMAAEKGKTLDLRDEKVKEELEGYTSLIARGEGAKLLLP